MKNESKISSGMKIGIIVEPYEERNASGIAQCILKQSEGLLELDKENEYIIYTSAPFKKERLSGNAKNIIIPKSFLGKNIWFIKNSIFNKSCISDILIFNMPLLPLVLPKHIKTIPIFYELIYKTHNGMSIKNRIIMAIQRFLVPIALKRAVHIITPSNATRDDILNTYKIKKEKIRTIYLGFQGFDKFDDLQKEHSFSYSYFLFVGKIKFKKNIHNIVDGFIDFKKNKKSEYKLYLAGDYGGNYYEEIKNKIKKSGFEKDIIFGGYMHDDDMYKLYIGASALVFCTLKEGFGMPVIEAMSLSVPVITSDMPPLNEIAESAAILVDPENIHEISNAMKEVVYNTDLRNKLIESGKINAKRFSWGKHNMSLLEIINKI